MKNLKRKMQYGLALLSVSALPAAAMAAELSADNLTSGITGAKDIMIAVAGAIFTLVGIYVAIRFGRKTAGG